MKRTSLLACTIALVMTAGTAHASGYIGLEAGSSTPEEDSFGKGSEFRLTGAKQVNENFAFEASYTSLGKFEADKETLALISAEIGETASKASVKINGIELGGVLIAPLNEKFAVYGRLGLYLWNSEVSVTVDGFGTGSDKDSGNDPFFGIGAMITPTEKVSFKFGYSKYNAFDADVDVISGGLNFNF